MKIVGVGSLGEDPPGIETIDVWYSQRRGAWCVERLDADGNQIGLSHCCLDEAEASACVAEWLRAHGTASVWRSNVLGPAERRILARSVRSAA